MSANCAELNQILTHKPNNFTASEIGISLQIKFKPKNYSLTHLKQLVQARQRFEDYHKTLTQDYNSFNGLLVGVSLLVNFYKSAQIKAKQ